MEVLRSRLRELISVVSILIGFPVVLQGEVEADNLEKVALKAMLQNVLSRRRLEEFSALVTAAKEGDVDLVRTLLMKGADINMVDYDGRSALAMVIIFVDSDFIS